MTRNLKNYKVLFADLDGTLIKTKSGETFPKGIWDMEFRFDTLDAIKKLKPRFIFIVSNQGGIESGFVDERSFQIKMDYIERSILEYCNKSVIEYLYCTSNDKNDEFRKPNIGMLEDIAINYFVEDEKSEMLMIGDASGKEGQFSNTDKITAENFGIDYLDVDDFVEQMKNK